MAEPQRRRRRVRHGSTAPATDEATGQAPDEATGREPAAPLDEPRPAAPSARATTDTRPTTGARATTGPRGNAGARGNASPAAPAAEREAERGLRGLVGSGSTQVSLAAAMRARDAARPTDADAAAAERDVVIIRRNWVPREDLPRR